MIRTIVIAVFVGLTVLIVGISWFLAPDNLMSCGDSPSDVAGCEKADVIIAVSGGDTAARTQEAITLYEHGWAPRLIFSGAALDKSGPSNAAVMRQQAINQGVPASAITIEQQSETTEQNAAKTSSILESKDTKSAVVVTSAYHMKRTMMEFRKKAPNIAFRAHPVTADDQWSVWWWTTPYGWYLAVSELVKITIVQFGGSSS